MLLRSTFAKRVVRAIRRRGVEIGYPRADTVDFIGQHRIDLVVDVGANDGHFARKIRINGYKGDIVSFEPTSGPFEAMKAAAATDPKWEVRKLGLADAPGSAKIHLSENTHFSSLRHATPAAVDHHAQARFIGTEKIELTTLDEVVKGYEGRRVFVKIDTQGYEEPVLRGARGVLASVIGVQMELPAVHFYEKVWQLADAMRFMDEAGFVLAQVHPVNYAREDPSSAVEFDCIYRSKLLTDPKRNPARA
jgi:FkbM family methyltransferase